MLSTLRKFSRSKFSQWKSISTWVTRTTLRKFFRRNLNQQELSRAICRINQVTIFKIRKKISFKEKDEEIQKYLKDNLAIGFIKRSITPAEHPVLFQSKKNGELRWCIDYQKLNQQTLQNSYPLYLIIVVFQGYEKLENF